MSARSSFMVAVMVVWMCVTSCDKNGYVQIPDPAFNQYCLEHFDTDNDRKINYAEADSVQIMVCNHRGIESLEGIAYFTSLRILECNQNQLTSLDLSANRKLERLSCRSNRLTSLDLSGNRELVHLICGKNH